MKIVITGSLGNISKLLTEELVLKGNAVTVISSKEDKKEEIEAIGAVAAIGSLEDAAFVAATFNGADAVYCMVPPNYAEGDPIAYYKRLGASYANAVKQTGVKRVVHLSSYGAHLNKGTGFILGSHNVEGLLDDLKDVAVTHLRAGFFYYNLYSFINMIKQAGFIGSNYGGDDSLVMVSPKDIAVAAAEELVKTGSNIQKVRYVASDEHTCNEVAAELGAVIGMPGLQWKVLPGEAVKDSMEKMGMPPTVADLFVEMGAAAHIGILRTDYDAHKPAVMGAVKLQDFAKEFAVAF